MPRRLFLLIPLAASMAAVVGCFNSHNPGYFPSLLPGGRIVQSHAKPRFGFFRDFDPKAARLDVTPRDASAPLGSQIVLVATVVDKDGDPRRSRRVEWLIDGPGNIIEVDEAGFYAGRGYKVDNKYAVTYTGYTSHTITRGNDDTKDDVEIGAGQTFCVVTSAVPGETTITAYAPGVFNWDKGRVATKIVWGEGRFGFPAPAVVRYGTEYTLSTTLTSIEQNNGKLPNYRVRYKVLDGDGAPAVLASAGGPGTSLSQAGIGAKEAETPLDPGGSAVVKIVQPTPQAGKTRVAVEVLKAPDNGVGPGTVVSRRETTVEWAAPQVKLDIAAPAAAGQTGPVPATVMLLNTGQVDARESQVRVSLSDGATLDRSEPPPVRQENGALVFDLPALGAGKKQEIALQVHPAKLGAFTVSADVSTADGLSGHKEATTRIENGKLGVHVEAPVAALSAEKIPVKIAVTNTGATTASNVMVWAQFDNGLSHASGKNPVEIPAGTIEPGQTKVVEAPLMAKSAGKFTLRTTATADGKVTAAGDPFTVEVRRAELTAAVDGPKLAYLNQDFTWTVAIGNNGDGPLANVQVRATLPAEVRVKNAGEGKIGLGAVEWRIDSLKPGEKKLLPITVETLQLNDRTVFSVLATADATGSGGASPVGDPIQARAQNIVALIGAPAVALNVSAPTAPVEIGKNASIQVRVSNKGTVLARNVSVTAFCPAEFKPLRGYGKATGQIDKTGAIVFPAIEELRPGETAGFTIEVEGAQVGDARFRVEVKAASLTAPLKNEQAIRVVGK